MLQYEEQGHGTMRNAAEQRTTPRFVRAMPQLKEQCHAWQKMPQHNAQCSCQSSGMMCNEKWEE